MGYSSNDLSSIPAVKYGVENQPIARDWYANQMRLIHQDFTCRESGFYIYQSKPFLGASPDGIVSCSCCGRGILEIKWSFKNKEKPSTQIYTQMVRPKINTDYVRRKRVQSIVRKLNNGMEMMLGVCLFVWAVNR